MRNLIYFIFAILLLSCKESGQQRITRLTEAWTGKPIYYPPDSIFESFETDSIRRYSLKRTDYTIVTYIDSSQNMNGERLREWKEFLHALQPVAKGKATCLFFFHPKNRAELIEKLRNAAFNYPVCIDEDDVFNKLNRFPPDSIFRTFLIDRENRILAMGNPVEDPQVKERYLRMIADNAL